MTLSFFLWINKKTNPLQKKLTNISRNYRSKKYRITIVQDQSFQFLYPEIKDMFEFTMSVQSMNQESLDATGRTNISKAAFKRMADTLRKGGRSTYAETIVPLPKETLSTFFRGMKE